LAGGGEGVADFDVVADGFHGCSVFSGSTWHVIGRGNDR
jgi:hypothetical protein